MTGPDHDAARWGVGVPPGYKATNTTAPDQPPASGLRDRIRDAIHAIHPDCGAYDSADCPARIQVSCFGGTHMFKPVTDWEAARRRMRLKDGRFSTLYLPVKVNRRYWITRAREHGRIHIATGRGIRRLSNSAIPDWITIEVACRTTIEYPRDVDSPESAPGFTLCPRCIAATHQEAC